MANNIANNLIALANGAVLKGIRVSPHSALLLDIDAYRRAAALPETLESGIAIALIYAYHSVLAADSPHTPVAGTADLFAGGVVYEYTNHIHSNVPAEVGGMIGAPRDCMHAFIQGMMGATAIRWVIDLTACYQTKELSAENIVGYFASLSNTHVTGNLIHSTVLAHYKLLPDILGVNALRALVSDAIFIDYHTSASSTPFLVSNVRRSLGAYAATFFGATDIQAVDAAVLAKHDLNIHRAIPHRLIMVAYVYLDVNQVLPAKWFTGIRVINAAPVNQVRALRTWFQRMSALNANEAAVNGANDRNALTAAVPAFAMGQ